VKKNLSFTKINSKWILDQAQNNKTYTRHKGENLGELGLGDEYLGTMPRALSMREKTNILKYAYIYIYFFFFFWKRDNEILCSYFLLSGDIEVS
jgi:hypothetical protein